MKRLGVWAGLLGLLVLGAAYLALGYVQVEPDEQVAVLRLGRYARTLGPGPAWHALWIDKLERHRITVTREEFGFRTISAEPPQEYRDAPEERRMLTGDEKLVDVQFVLQYQIRDLAAYLFNVTEVPAVVRDVAQAAIRDVVAQRPIDGILTVDKGLIEIQTRDRIQALLDAYGAGVEIQSVQLQEVEPPEEVKEAFRDVVGAEQDRERLILEAHGYADQVVPRARGEAQELINQAQGYKESLVLEAQGAADRFSALLVEYRKAPEVTRERLYLETLEEILPRMEKVIVEEGQSDRVLPYLPVGRKGREP